MIRSGSGLHGILVSYKKHISLLQTNVNNLMDGAPASVGLSGLESGLRFHNGPVPLLLMSNVEPILVPKDVLLQQMEDRIAFLEKQSAVRHTVGNSMTVQFEGQLFKCQQDMENYATALIFPSVPPSLVNDFYTLLQAIMLALQGDHIDIREIHSIGQIGSNISEADVRNRIVDNQNSVPPFFKGTSKSSSLYTEANHRLKDIPTFEFWGKPGPVDGYNRP